ncbi:hypothetical protein [Brevibacillus brevis]|uniref:hypothetical protein n=1 Tax=Brevibacillus brevis TaxID=1393 RepID=UPI000D0E68E1|nr:hypothetical protein [Brevibacillus brevis]PSJ68786.1 hypothetical protein C7J99_12410 [Brevibacillus brevis]RED29335.1 hypothetical protein DES34_106123 [Brevibacillus brevis]GEC91514.1 hypothetical protein BBR01nite_38450 [Brevibacillus brevis]VEF87936.1 Uncharacterised protein [Brevibacillus brevis]
MILAAVVFLTIISMKELSTLIHKSMRKELVIYGLFTAINLFVAVLTFMEIEFPLPQNAIDWIAQTLFGVE